MRLIILYAVILVGLFSKTLQFGIQAFKGDGEGALKKTSIFVLLDIACVLLFMQLF